MCMCNRIADFLYTTLTVRATVPCCLQIHVCVADLPTSCIQHLPSPVPVLQISQDPRYTALPERRCRQLFNQYHSTLKDLQSAPATPPPSSSSPPPPAASPTPATASSSSTPGGDQSLLSAEEEQAGEVASRLGRLSEQLAASALQQSGGEEEQYGQSAKKSRPVGKEEQYGSLGQGLAALTQPSGAQLPRGGVAGSSKGGQSGVQLDALEALRQEQARLKAEYDRMEVRQWCARVQEMESVCLCVCVCVCARDEVWGCA